MKNEQEKSDPSIVAKEAGEQTGNRRGRPLGYRGGVGEGKGPRETRESNARAGRRAGEACTRGSNVYEK
jgi:hypothetical protein